MREGKNKNAELQKGSNLVATNFIYSSDQWSDLALAGYVI